MRSLTAAQMREADRRCIEELGIPGVVLMNNAGGAVFREVSALLCERNAPQSSTIGVVCGKGNNGGDGFVVARLALLAGHRVRTVLIASPSNIQGDAALFLRVYERLGGQTIEAPDEDAARSAIAGMSCCDVIVDALLGTGISGEVCGAPRAAIEAWPDVATVAVDLPSGLDADAGAPCGACVRADVTVTFQFPKRGFDNPAAAAYLGRVAVADIGIPPACADDAAWSRLITNAPQA